MSDERRPMRDRRAGCALPLFAGAIGIPLLALCALAWVGPPSVETMLLSAVVLAFVITGFARRRRAAWTCVGLALAIVGYRLLDADEGSTISVDPSSAVRLTDRIVPERDVALGASALLVAVGALREPGLLDALRDGYSRMSAAEGAVPSPVIGTFMFGQTPDDHVVLRVARGERANAALVFLHGSMGNVTVECWQVAQAALPHSIEVACPSTTWRAAWASADGVAIVRRTIASLRARGFRRIYLGGLSAGAIGASRIARRLDVRGVVLISGADPAAVPKRVPTLILQGRRDRMTPPSPARAYARRLGSLATYREHATAGHWMILSEHAWTTEQLSAWLAARERTR